MKMFSGVGVALVTPFNDKFEVDYDAIRKLVDSVINGGVDYIVALGTTAETPTLNEIEKKTILKTIIEQNNNRVKIVCGIGGNNTQEVINTIKEYTSLFSIDGILSVTPYYNKPSQEGLFQHYDAIAQSTSCPIILYNVPGRTQSNILPTTVHRLAVKHNNIVAIKEASGNMSQCMELVQLLPEHFTILSGDDNLVLPQISIGMHGVISVAANAYPVHFCKMVNSAVTNDYKTAQSIHYKILDCTNALFTEGNPTGIKALLHHKNLLENYLRLPLVTASNDLFNILSTYKNLD